MVFVRSTALAETYESRFSTKGRCTSKKSQKKERQKALQDYVTNTPKPNHNTRVITDRPRGGGREDDHRPTAEGEASTTPDGQVRLPRYHGVDYLSYAETVSAAKTPPKKGVSVTNYPVEPKSDRGEAGWGYLEGREYARRLCKVRLCHVSCGDDCTSVTRS